MTETKEKPKRINLTFNPPATWFKIDRHYAEITPLPNVLRATRTQAVALDPHHGNECTYYRSEVFPTYSEAAAALATEMTRIAAEYERKAEQAKREHDDKSTLAARATFMKDRAQTTPNPDAILDHKGWIHFVTAAAINISKTIEVPQGDTLTEDSYRTRNLINAQAFADILRKHGLTVAH